jgi:hypothetical protein
MNMDRCRREIRRAASAASIAAALSTSAKVAMSANSEVSVEVPSLLRELWKLTGGDPLSSTRAAAAFDDAGLILIAPPRWYGYESTPTNATSFATTGGDGVHYSWLTFGEVDAETAPIVMTVPMAAEEHTNIIVGENLRDFLNLGCRYGYFPLEQLAYNWDATVRELEMQRVAPDAWPEKRGKLKVLTDALGLAPWPNPRQRLRELQDKHRPKVQLRGA